MGVAETEPPPQRTPERRGLARYRELLIALAGLALGVAVFAAVPQLRHAFSLSVHGNLSGLRHYIRGLGGGGLALLFALMLAHAVVFYPTEILTATTAYVYGFVPGLAFAMVGWVFSALVSYLLGRSIGRPLLRTVLGSRFARLEQAVERGGTQLMLTARLIPIVPFSLLGYAVGATHGRVIRLMWTTAVGYLPLTAAVAYLGSRAQSLSVSDPFVWVAVVVVIALISIARMLGRRTSL
ncbi:MAG TPA: VTT domain-containing protein [Solirubrobacteraceae bacterium]|nr:VTT domain-containing protein [Solirubrobacteraceae bacterium]